VRYQIFYIKLHYTADSWPIQYTYIRGLHGNKDCGIPVVMGLNTAVILRGWN